MSSAPGRTTTVRPRRRWRAHRSTRAATSALTVLVLSLAVSAVFAAGFAMAPHAPGTAMVGVPPPLLPSAISGEVQNLSPVSIVYDPATGTVLAVTESVSASGTFAPTLRTWSLAGSEWTDVNPPTAPSGRVGSSLVYDPTTGSVVLFGGLGPSGYLADTWSYSGGTWSNVTGSAGAAPAPRAAASFVWDASSGAGVLFGGVGAQGTSWSNSTTGQTSTWLFASGQWTSTNQASGTVPASTGAVAYDPAIGAVVDASPYATPSGCASTAATYEFENSTWANVTSLVGGSPPSRSGGAATYDPSSSSVVLFGGQDCLGPRDDSWSFNGRSWTPLATSPGPSARSSGQLVYDPTLSESVLFGGFGGSGPVADTWALAGTNWSQIGPALTVPGALEVPGGEATDAGMNLTMSVRGDLTTGTTQFSYTGLPDDCLAPNLATFVCDQVGTGRLTLSGTVSSALGTARLAPLSLELNALPRIVGFTLTGMETEPGVPVTLGTSVQNGTGSYSYNYTGLPASCSSANASSITCDPTSTGLYQVGVVVTDQVGGRASVNRSFVVGPHPFVESVAANRTVLDVWLSTHLSLVAGGGTGPLTFAYSGLPTGCATANATSIECAPTVDGNFTVQATAADEFGFEAASNALAITVHPRLAVAQFTSNASSVVLGGSVSFAFASAGGTAPYRYGFVGLPVGCAAAPSGIFSCITRSTGTYRVQATVIDSLGEFATANLTLVVAPVSPAPILPSPTPAGTGGDGPSASLLVLGILAGVVMVSGVLGAWVRRGRHQARAGRALVTRLIDEAEELGARYGPMDGSRRR